jgi:hypothetical protein
MMWKTSVIISQRPSLLSATPGRGSSSLTARILIASRKAVSTGSSCMIPSNLLVISSLQSDLQDLHGLYLPSSRRMKIKAIRVRFHTCGAHPKAVRKQILGRLSTRLASAGTWNWYCSKSWILKNTTLGRSSQTA